MDRLANGVKCAILIDIRIGEIVEESPRIADYPFRRGHDAFHGSAQCAACEDLLGLVRIRRIAFVFHRRQGTHCGPATHIPRQGCGHATRRRRCCRDRTLGELGGFRQPRARNEHACHLADAASDVNAHVLLHHAAFTIFLVLIDVIF